MPESLKAAGASGDGRLRSQYIRLAKRLYYSQTGEFLNGTDALYLVSVYLRIMSTTGVRHISADNL
jgi:hypothetical protein